MLQNGTKEKVYEKLDGLRKLIDDELRTEVSGRMIVDILRRTTDETYAAIKRGIPDFSKMYSEFETRYNPYPTQMSRAEAFGKAFHDGLIDEKTYNDAREYYKNLWNYVGD